MNVLQRIEQAEAQRRSPDNVVPLDSHPRRTKARWLEIQQQSKAAKDLTGYVSTGSDAA